MPRISKECLGGFVGFQRLTIDPNQKVSLSKFFVLSSGGGSPHTYERALDFSTAWKNGNTNCVFPKENSTSSISERPTSSAAPRSSHNTFVDLDPRDVHIAFMNSSQAKRFLGRQGWSSHRNAQWPAFGPAAAWRIEGDREGLWRAVLKQPDIKE
jgi:hypothetical protein